MPSLAKSMAPPQCSDFGIDRLVAEKHDARIDNAVSGHPVPRWFSCSNPAFLELKGISLSHRSNRRSNLQVLVAKPSCNSHIRSRTDKNRSAWSPLLRIRSAGRSEPNSD